MMSNAKNEDGAEHAQERDEQREDMTMSIAKQRTMSTTKRLD